ncbi:beta-lactamase fold-containing exonuclease [Tubulinosema ratisbonensis]|uniref:Endoribonuclease YSH1 n=1 Tax=Tubulinosema ratisbonensis TaxID=291195 RepID=A0A437AN94_9MICR|nr:beta-lactamase fold-containing exonuclease [Tubulinosema ratisbonensis]
MEKSLTITPLGAGSEVGRSCLHIKYLETQIILDCGIHPAYTGQSSLPFLDLVDLSKIDAIFVTHFHLDHGGALPYITEKTNFNGRVFMTHPTKSILRLLLNDYSRLVSAGVEDSFSDNELKKCMDRIRTIDYYQQIRINDLKITALNAGHVLGAAMFMIQASSSLILYTGDYSREEDRHLKMADLPSVVNYQKNAGNLGNKLDILVCESTYGVGCHLPKEERESRFINEIMKILNRGGRALLPVFALGRAQELLLILEEHWRQHKLRFKIYYVSTLARKCISVYQTYLTMMNANIQKQTDPFNFKYVSYLDSINSFDDNEPCVMVCSPGMLQSGISRELFDNWCVNDKNGVILTGYSVPGTLAKEILGEPTHITTLSGNKVPLKMSVSFISFSAHVDFLQNSAYISEVNPEKLFLVHGEVNEMHRLKNAITHNNKETDCIILRNGESSTLEIKENENISLPIIKEDVVFKGILVKSKKMKVIKPEGINLIQKQCIKYNNSIESIKNVFLSYFTDVIKIEKDGNDHKILFIDEIKVEMSGQTMKLEWNGSFKNDLMAMTICRVSSLDENAMFSLKPNLSAKEALIDLLKNYFSNVYTEKENVYVKEEEIVYEIEGRNVIGDGVFKGRIENLVEKIYKIFL